MDTGSTINQALPILRRITTSVRLTQWCIGFTMNVPLTLPHLRRAHGMAKLDSRRRYVFACSHGSLLDMLLLGALVWRCDFSRQ